MSAIVFFDGVCNLCHASVRFIAKRDSKAYFRFASLQSELAAKLIPASCREASGDSIILWEEGRCEAQSTAALNIARRLRFPWPIFYLGMILPRFLRDGIYRWIARNRYRWFGKRETCDMPDPKLRDRLLNDKLPDPPQDKASTERH